MTQEIENEHSGYTNELLTVKTPVLRLPLQLGEAEHPRWQDPTQGLTASQWHMPTLSHSCPWLRFLSVELCWSVWHGYAHVNRI